MQACPYQDENWETPQGFIKYIGGALESIRELIVMKHGFNDRDHQLGPMWFLEIGKSARTLLGDRFNEAEFIELLLSKHKRYGPFAITRWGIPGLIIRLDSKYQRAKNLFEQPTLDTATDESVFDTITDIVGYCVLGYIYALNPKAYQ